MGTVCHGPAILPGIIDAKTGKSIIHGKTVTSGRVATGTNPASARSAAERAVKVFDTLPSE